MGCDIFQNKNIKFWVQVIWEGKLILKDYMMSLKLMCVFSQIHNFLEKYPNCTFHLVMFTKKVISDK